MRRTIFTLHLYLALISGLFVFILGVTGAIMAFEPEIDRLTHRSLVRVTPQGSALPLADIAAKVESAYPGEHVTMYGIGVGADESYMLGVGQRYVFVDPYRGTILGERTPGPTVLSTIHQIHLRLALSGVSGDPGKKLMSWAGVAILLLLLSGLYLWWPLKRLRVDWAARGRLFWFNVHNTLGVLSFVFLFLLALTGIAIGFEGQSLPLFYALTGSAPMNMGPFPPETPDSPPVGIDQVVATARAALPGAQAFSVAVPGPTAPYAVRMRFPEDLTPGGRSMVMIHHYTGEVLHVQSSRTGPAGRRIEVTNRAIHTGDIFGLPSKIVMSLASLALAVQAVAGVMMWLKRRAQS